MRLRRADIDSDGSSGEEEEEVEPDQELEEWLAD